MKGLVGVLILALSLGGCYRSRSPDALSAEQALETFELHPDFAIELFAAEPLVVDPVAMEIDADGRIFVVENSGYPLDVEGHRGRVKLLSDEDGDGRPDRAAVFADRLVMPTGVMAWKAGILVTDPPNVLYLEDRDGDGQADVRETVLAGFAFTNPQHTVSSPVYGLDNWIYLSHEGYTRAVVFDERFGDRGEEIHYPAKPNGPRVPVTRRNVRFRPDSFELELLAGPSQFGTAFNEWGDIFTHDNSNHARHEPIAARYLERNPALRLESVSQDMFDEGNPATVYPITVNPRFEMLTGVGVMTSASGLTRYLGGAFPGYEDAAFVAEPAHNLVHADRWRPSGATYAASRLEPADREFLASRDPWFRPVNFYVGPDGALYVLDYYRAVIEHPEWTSAEVYESEDPYQGDDQGRIWRITPKDGLPVAAPHPATYSDLELTRELRSRNIWRRRTAQRLLVERGRKESVRGALKEMARDDASAVAKAHALWTLGGLGVLETDVLLAALADQEPGVRRNAIVLLEPRLMEEPQLVRRLLKLRSDPAPKVRFQLLLTLGSFPSAETRALRDDWLIEHFEEPWFQTAALTWPNTDPLGLYTRAAEAAPEATASEAAVLFFERLGGMAGASDGHAGLAELLGAVERDDADWRRAATLRGLADRLRNPKSIEERHRKRILNLALSAERDARAAALNVLEETGLGEPYSSTRRRASAWAAVALNSASAPVEDRIDALRLLCLADPSDEAERLRDLLSDPRQPAALQAAAARAFGRIDGEETAAFLLERLTSLPPEARTAAIEALYETPARERLLLEAISDGKLQPWMLSFSQKRRLLMHNDAKFRERARELLTETASERRRILDRYRAALALDANVSRGRIVFERVCKECHQFQGFGAEVGPDLSTVSGRPALAILADILDPNQSIAQTYEAYIIETTDGDVLDGVLGPQTPTSITLRREGGLTEVVERSRIREMRAAQLSAMPENMEERVTVEEMADLIRFIKSARAPATANADRERRDPESASGLRPRNAVAAQ